MEKFAEIVSTYPHKYPIIEKEDYFYWPAKLMQDSGYDVEFLTTEKGEQKNHKGIQIKRFKNPFSILSHINKDKDIKLVHAHLRPYPPSFLAAFSNKPKILTPHTYILGSSRPIAHISKLAMRKFNKVIALTPYERDIYLKAGITNTELIPHPVDYDFFSKPPNKPALKKRFGLKDEFIIVTVANIRKIKRLDILLKAFKIVNEKTSSKLVIIGHDMLNEENAPTLRSMITDLRLEESTIHTGALEPELIRDMLHSSNVFVNTSMQEVQCLSAYEAAASGIPLCLPRIGSFTSVFGDLATFHDPGDHEKLAQDLNFLYENRNEFRKQGLHLKKFVKKFSFEPTKHKMVQLYESVLGSKLNQQP